MTYPRTSSFKQDSDLLLPKGECNRSTQQVFVFLEIRFRCTAQAGLKHAILLPLTLKDWNYRLSDHT